MVATGELMRSPYPGEPRYRLLARSLREEILDDRYAEDEPLPTENALAETYGLSRQTVRRAYLDLVSEGLVFRVPGRGTFVTPKGSRYRRQFSTVTDLMNLTLDTDMEVVEPLTGMYDPTVAERMQVTGRALYSVLFRRRHRGEIFCTTRVYLPAAVGASLDDMPSLIEEGRRSDITIIGLLESRGIAIAGAEQVTTAVAASKEQARLLGCRVGAPLLHIERLYIDDDGSPVELAISDFLPEHYSHRLTLGRGA